MSFFAELEWATARHRAALYSVPQIVDSLQGAISREAYLAYLGQAYHQVRQTVPLLTCAQEGMGADRGIFRAALREYIADATGHEAWVLNDIANAGGDVGGVCASPPAPATERLLDFVDDYVSRINPMGVFGMIYVLDGASVSLATAGAGAIAAALGLGPECFTYLTSHGRLDLDHMTFFERLTEEIHAREDREAIVDVAQQVFGLFADMFRALPHAPSTAHVV